MNTISGQHAMTGEQARKTLWDLDFIANMSFRYYEYLSFALAVADRVLKFLIGLTAVFTLACEFKGHGHPDEFNWTLWLAVFTAVSAVLINICPLDIWERRFHSLKIQWKEFQFDLADIQVQLFGRPLDVGLLVSTWGTLNAEIPQDAQAAIRKLLAKKQSIDVDEDFNWGWLVRKVTREERQRRWGSRVLTNDQALAEFDRLQAEHRKATEAAVAA